MAEDTRRELDAAVKTLGSFDLGPGELGDADDWQKDANLANLNLIAPLSGTVTSLSVRPGGRVAEYEALATIADLTRLLVFAVIGPDDLERIRSAGLEQGRFFAGVRVSGRSGELLVGEVSGMDQSPDADPRPGSLRIEVNNEGETLRPGMHVVVWVELSRSPRVRTVPRNAVWGRPSDRFLLIRWKDGLWLRRSVVLEKRKGSLVDVRGSVPEGATLGVCRLHER